MEIKLATPVTTQHFDVTDYKTYEEFLEATKEYLGTTDFEVVDSIDIPKILLSNGVNPLIWTILAKPNSLEILDFIECEGLYDDYDRMFEVVEERSQGHFESEKDWIEHFACEYLGFTEEQLQYMDYAVVSKHAFEDHWYGWNGYVIAV